MGVSVAKGQVVGPVAVLNTGRNAYLGAAPNRTGEG